MIVKKMVEERIIYLGNYIKNKQAEIASRQQAIKEAEAELRELQGQIIIESWQQQAKSN